MDSEKVIKDLEEYRDREFIQEGITIFDNDPRYRKLIINNTLALLKEQAECIKNLEHQLETITRWRANAGAFD